MAEKRFNNTNKNSLDEMNYIICGEDFVLNDKLVLHNPTIREIKELKEINYLILINQLTMRPYDDMVGLDEKGINYLDVTDFEIFVRNIIHLPKELTSIIFGDIDFQQFHPAVNKINNQPIITNGEIVIDELIYQYIVDYIRGINFISAEVEYEPGNETFRKALIDKKKREIRRNSKKPFESRIGNILSFVVNEGKIYNYNTILDIKISQLYDSFYRLNHLQNYRQTMSGVYAGTVKYADLDKAQINWAGKITK